MCEGGDPGLVTVSAEALSLCVLTCQKQGHYRACKNKDVQEVGWENGELRHRRSPSKKLWLFTACTILEHTRSQDWWGMSADPPTPGSLSPLAGS